jgi:hypothetical protein
MLVAPSPFRGIAGIFVLISVLLFARPSLAPTRYGKAHHVCPSLLCPASINTKLLPSTYRRQLFILRPPSPPYTLELSPPVSLLVEPPARFVKRFMPSHAHPHCVAAAATDTSMKQQTHGRAMNAARLIQVISPSKPIDLSNLQCELVLFIVKL